MTKIFRRTFAALATLVALLAAPVALAVPSITITSPTTNSTLTPTNTATLGNNPPAVTISVNATATAGSSISSVTFLVNGSSIGTVGGGASGVYTFNWQPTSTGTFNLTTSVVDTSASSNTATSPLVIVTIAEIGPSVTLIAPAPGSIVGAGAPLGLSANVFANAGSGSAIARVDFLAGTTVLGTSFASPYTFSWTPTTAGSFNITARATDVAGITAVSTPVNVTVTVPSVALTSPLNGTGVSVGAPVALTANASAVSPATVSRVDFIVGSTVVGTATSSPFTVNWTPTSAGTSSITARVTDSNGAQVTSSAISVTATTSIPSVSLNSPAAGATLALGAPVTLNATAAGSGSTTVTRVDFLSGSTVVATVLSPPFQATWTPTAAGVTTLTARVTDSNGTTATSAAVNVNVVGPAVVLTAPTAGSTVATNSAVTLTATGTAASGTSLSKIEFFAGATLVNTVTSPASGTPVSVTWTPTATGAVSLTARATDSNNAQVTSTAVSVTVSNNAPTVSITSPANAATIAGNTAVTITVNATAVAGSTISSVAFFVDGNQIGVDTSAPYAVTWTATPAGLHALTAVATDSLGATTTSAGINVTVGAISTPTVSLTAPVFGAASIVGSPVTVSATAVAGSSGTIAKVDFYADNLLIGTDFTSPYSISWTPVAAGTPTLTAKVTDTNGVNGFSAPIAILVNPAGTPTIALSVVGGGGSLIVPVGSSRMLVATTADDGVVDHVDFFLDGVLLGTDGVAPYTFNYVAGLEVGPHTFTAVVTDNSGLTTTSAPVNISIVGAIGSAPTARVLTPTDGAFATSGSVTTINVIAADSDGTVSKVEVFANGILLTGTTFTSGIWSTAWTPTTIGPVSIMAIATDDKTNATVSATSSVTVTDSTAPTITLGVTPGTNATTGTTLPAGSTRNVLATVSSSVAGRAVSRVEFFINGTTKVGERVTPPYSYRFKAPADPGIYVLTARATDNAGLSRDVYYTFTVTAAVGNGPTVRLLTPTNNITVVPNTAVTMAASAISSGGTIANVQFYADGIPVAGAIAPPTNFTTTYTPTTPGTHILDAIATDDRGNTTISNSVTLNAAFGTPTISITSPNPAVTARATPNVPFTVTVNATPGTGAGVFLVELLVDGQQVATRAPTPPPTASGTYSFQWTPTTSQIGAHQIVARITDTNSLSATTAATLNVNVSNPVGAPPTLSNLSPANNAIVQSLSTVNFQVTATPGGNATITSVEFYLNDNSIGTAVREQSTNVYRRAFDMANFDLTALTVNETTGRYPVSLYAIARDSNGNQTIFPAPTATNPTPTVINISPSLSQPPSVTLTSFSVGGGPNSVTVSTPFFMTATPSDPDGTVTSMQLFVNGVSSGAAIANPQPGALIQYTPNAQGSYNLYVVVTDDTGNTAVSTPSVVLNATVIPAPSTQLVRPADDTVTATVGSPIFLEATASGTGNNATQIPTVQFFASAANGQRTTINATRVGTTNVYRAIWTPTLATGIGTFTIVSSATIGTSPAGTSQVSRRVVVNELVGIAPTVTISVPSTVSSASTANLTATANDSDGAVTSVEFYLNRVSLGFATRDQLTSTWRLSAPFVGVPLGSTEIVALVRDSSNNVAASTTNFINVVAATSLAPTFTTITATPNSVATSRQVQLTANARDTDGTVSVQYFANGVSIGTGFNPNTSYLVNWTPTVSGTYTISAVATDNSTPANTAVAAPINVTVRRNNPLQDDTSFIIQSYSDIANTTNINPLVLASLADQLAAGTMPRSQIVIDLMDEAGFVAPVNLLAAYWVLMGQWPTPANYTTLLATTRGAGLSTGINSILFSNEYFAKYGYVPTVALLNNPASVIPADTFINNLWRGAGLGSPSALQNFQFRNNTTATATLGRGYTVAGLPTALAEFITNTNSTNTALLAKARAAALYYQLDRPPTPTNQTAKEITDAIAVRIDGLVKLADDAARIDSLLKDQLYTYRYVTFLKQPQSLVVAPRSGALFSVEATGAPPILYQWLFNGTPIANATGATLSLTNVDTTRVGTYTVVVTTTAGSATSDPATLTLSNAITRVANISTRGVTTGAGAQQLIAGFVIANPPGAPANQTRQMLIRVAGPALTAAPFNLTGVLANPSLEVYNAAGQQILANDNWMSQSANAAANATAVTALQQATNRIGTFPFANNSQDAAILATLQPGTYTVQANGPNANSTGVVLVEVYDATAGNAVATSPKAANVSTRGEVGTGNNILIAGFVINGTVSRRVLLRGVGPTLRNFGIGQNAVLADPFLTLKDSAGTTLRTNDDWAAGDDAAVIAAAAASGGAFALANGSKDSAMIVMLPPGAYTVQLSGVNNTTGLALVEVYDVDP